MCVCVVCVVLCVVQSVFPAASRLFFDKVDDIESVMLRVLCPSPRPACVHVKSDGGVVSYVFVCFK